MTTPTAARPETRPNDAPASGRSLCTAIRRVLTGGGLAAALLAAAVVTAPVAMADEPPDIIENCGWFTCSTYYSHDATVELDRVAQQIPATELSYAAGFACIIGGPTACIPAGAIAFGVDNTTRIIHHAATTNGCVRFRVVRGTDDVIGNAVYSDHSSTCRSMD